MEALQVGPRSARSGLISECPVSNIHIHVYNIRFWVCIIFRTESKIDIKKILTITAIKLLID